MTGVVDGKVVWVDVQLVIADSVYHVAAVLVVVVEVVVAGVELAQALVGVVGAEREAVLVPVEVSEDAGDAVAVLVRVDVADEADGSEVAGERVAVARAGSKVVPVLANMAEAVAGVATYLVLAMERRGKQTKAFRSLSKICIIFPSQFWRRIYMV